jgi:hypothetical protein
MNSALSDISSKDLPGGFVNAQVQLPPGSLAHMLIFPGMPFPGAIDPQTGGIDNDVPCARMSSAS